MSEAIVDVSKLSSPENLTADVCVVGSGSAGATVAWELAARGLDVVVLEEGGDYTGFELNQRDARMYDQLYMERAGRATSDMGVTILQGRVLGGGGVVNTCDVEPIHDATLRHWQTRFGLTDFSPEALEPSRQAALRDLHANLPREDQLNANNRLLRQGASALGWAGEVMRHNRVGCLGLGTCMLGCPINAKKNPRFVAIPNAIEAGARFYTRARAVKIENTTAEVKTVRARQLDANGYRERATFDVRAKTVVLAANALASTQLLLRSGVGNEHVGRHVSLQPQLPVTALFANDIRFFKGIPQAYAVTEFQREGDPAHGWWGYRIESIAGTPGIVSTLLSRVGAEGLALMKNYAQLAAVLCLTPDDSPGRVAVEASGRMKVHYTLAEEHKKRLRDAAKNAARLFLSVGAIEVMVPSTPAVSVRNESELARFDALDFRPASTALLSAHQQGGVRMAPSANDGAASPTGEVYGTTGVYVMDSAGYPSSASSHTMAPIISIARFLSQAIG